MVRVQQLSRGYGGSGVGYNCLPKTILRVRCKFHVYNFKSRRPGRGA